MAINRRAFQSEVDKLLMAELACRFAADHLHTIDLPYRLSSWALDCPENTCMWFEGQKLVAWAVLQTPFWAVDYACAPARASCLFPAILSWADERAHAVSDTVYSRPAWFVNVFQDQVERISDLEQAGFTCQSDTEEGSWSKVWMARPGQAPLRAYWPPDGFTVRPLAGGPEAAAYVDLHQAVFESKNMTLDWRLRVLGHLAYVPELDIVVEAPDRRLAAFCIGWVSQHEEGHLSGQIEPLGCHPDFRRYALGRVALAEVLRRLQSMGVETIFVETDNYRDTAFRLYESLGFPVIREVLVYRKDYEGGRT